MREQDFIAREQAWAEAVEARRGMFGELFRWIIGRGGSAVSEYVVRFTERNACEVTTPDGKVLLCRRDAPGKSWEAPWARIDGQELRTPSCFSLSADVRLAILDAEVGIDG